MLGPVSVNSVQVMIPAEAVVLDGDLAVPKSPRGLVIFAHGSGSSRLSSRNRWVASAMNEGSFATLLFDLLTRQEDSDRAHRFDVRLLAQRLAAALAWARDEKSLRVLPMGLFGASTGAAAAIVVAATHPEAVSAVVSRGGRPDLAGDHALAQIRTPTLLLVGGADEQVLALNREAQSRMRAWAELRIVPGATHLFEEPGALGRVAALATAWFSRWLVAKSPG